MEVVRTDDVPDPAARSSRPLGSRDPSPPENDPTMEGGEDFLGGHGHPPAYGTGAEGGGAAVADQAFPGGPALEGAHAPQFNHFGNDEGAYGRGGDYDNEEFEVDPADDVDRAYDDASAIANAATARMGGVAFNVAGGGRNDPSLAHQFGAGDALATAVTPGFAQGGGHQLGPHTLHNHNAGTAVQNVYAPAAGGTHIQAFAGQTLPPAIFQHGGGAPPLGQPPAAGGGAATFPTTPQFGGGASLAPSPTTAALAAASPFAAATASPTATSPAAIRNAQLGPQAPSPTKGRAQSEAVRPANSGTGAGGGDDVNSGNWLRSQLRQEPKSSARSSRPLGSGRPEEGWGWCQRALWTLFLLAPLLYAVEVHTGPHLPGRMKMTSTSSSSAPHSTTSTPSRPSKVSDVEWVEQQGPWQFSVKRFGDEAAKNNTVPNSMFLIDEKLLWCPNAKAGTTSMYENLLEPANLLPSNRKGGRCYGSCPLSAWKLLSQGRDHPQAVMRAPSLTIIRNPWDRLRSAYVDKILSKKIIPSHGHVTKEERRRIVPMSFVEFVEHVRKHPQGNIHWMPHSERCLSVANNSHHGVFHYDHVIRIEDGMFEQLEQIFGFYGLPFPEGEVAMRNTKKHTQDKDGELREFYSEAATSNVSMKALVETVGRIYRSDVDLGNYAFPW